MHSVGADKLVWGYVVGFPPVAFWTTHIAYVGGNVPMFPHR